MIKGPAGVEKFFAGLFGAGVTGHKLELIEANGEGSTVVAAAKWSAKGKDGASLGGIATHEFAARQMAASSSGCTPSTEAGELERPGSVR